MAPRDEASVQLKMSGYDVHFPFKPYASQLVREQKKPTPMVHRGITNKRRSRPRGPPHGWRLLPTPRRTLIPLPHVPLLFPSLRATGRHG